MGRIKTMHPDNMGKIYSNTFEDLRWARIYELTGDGFDERAADLFARLEIEKKKKLALEIGPQRALLSTLHHKVEGDRFWSCRIKYTPPPEGLSTYVFCGFDD
jgi:hypothetical protein